MKELSVSITAIVVLFIFTMPLLAQDVSRQVLHENWTLRASSRPGAQPVRAEVPGTVQLQLIEDGLLPDPYYGTNEKLVQWVGETGWTYALNFAVDHYDSTRHYQLTFQGLDTYAEVVLNGSIILRADNMFRTWSVDVGELLQPSNNRLRVHFTPPAQALAPF
ncbi:MAG: glycoside hydrolase family 2 protein, partial [Bacteroidetes bacterium]